MPPLVQPVISATGLVMSRSERELQADRVHTRLKKRSGLCSCVTQEALEAQQIPVTVESFFRDLGQLSLKKKKLQQLISIRMHTMDLKVTQSNIIT